VRLHVVPIVSFIRVGFDERFFADFWIVLGVPLFEICFAHGSGIAGGVVARRFVTPGLRSEGHAEFGDFKSTFRALEAVGFW
jgi:hypothetical protein